MLRRRNRSSGGETIVFSDPTPVPVDLRTQSIGIWGCTPTDVMIDGEVSEVPIVSKTASRTWSHSTRGITERSTICATNKMGTLASSDLVADVRDAGYVIPDEKGDALVGGPGIVGVREVDGPLKLKCVDVDGYDCEYAETCRYKSHADSLGLFVLGGFATVEVPHFPLAQE